MGRAVVADEPELAGLRVVVNARDAAPTGAQHPVPAAMWACASSRIGASAFPAEGCLGAAQPPAPGRLPVWQPAPVNGAAGASQQPPSAIDSAWPGATMTWSSTRTSTSARVVFRVCVRASSARLGCTLPLGGCAPAPHRRPGGAGRAAPPRGYTLVCVSVPRNSSSMPSRRFCASRNSTANTRALGGQVQLQVCLTALGESNTSRSRSCWAKARRASSSTATSSARAWRGPGLDAFQVAGAGMQQPGDAAKSAADPAAGRVQHGGSSSSCAICSTPCPRCRCAAGWPAALHRPGLQGHGPAVFAGWASVGRF